MRVGEAERGPPRASDDEPALYPQIGSDPLDIGNLVGGRVRAGAEIGMTAPRAALIEKDRPEAARVEQVAMRMLGAAARPTMQEHSRYACSITTLFDI